MTALNSSLILIALTAALAAGCGSHSKHVSQSPLDLYDEYRNDVAHDLSADQLLGKYWTQPRVKEGHGILEDKSESNRLARNAAEYSVKFPSLMSSQLDAQQTTKTGWACVLVVGKAPNAKRVSFNITYLNESGEWKIDDVTVRYLELAEPTPSSPQCSE